MATLGIIFLSYAANSQCKMAGTIENAALDSRILKKTIEYKIYQPTTTDDTATYPVLYLLHGHGGSQRDWFEHEWGRMGSILDSLICLKKIPPTIAVSADAGNSWYVDRAESMESFYLDEFIPFIEAKYPIDGEKGRILAGNSAGGYGSLRFSLKQPERFDQVILLSPASYEPLPPKISSSRKIEAFALNGVFNDSVWNHFSYTHQLPNLKTSKQPPTYYISSGDDDGYNIVPVAVKIQQELNKLHIKNELRITNGGHDWLCWRLNVTHALLEIYHSYNKSVLKK